MSELESMHNHSLEQCFVENSLKAKVFTEVVLPV